MPKVLLRIELVYVYFDIVLFKIEVHFASRQVLLNVLREGKMFLAQGRMEMEM